jgi:hypothetical protein
MTRRIIRRFRNRPAGVDHTTGDCSGRDCARDGHEFGPWGSCACQFGIPAHTENVGWFQVVGWCGWEHRLCRHCLRGEERRAEEYPTEPLRSTGGVAAGGEDSDR